MSRPVYEIKITTPFSMDGALAFIQGWKWSPVVNSRSAGLLDVYSKNISYRTKESMYHLEQCDSYLGGYGMTQWMDNKQNRSKTETEVTFISKSLLPPIALDEIVRY